MTMIESDPFGLVNRTVSDTFRVDELVAEGGCGVVYRGFHEHFRSPIALKVLKVPAGLPNKVRTSFWEEFRREAEVQFRLSALTQFVVRPFHIGQVDVGREHPLPIMALEWLEGMDLEAEGKLRKRSGIPPRTLASLLDLLSGAAKAIHLAHNFERDGGHYSVIHRDIKPENLFVTHRGHDDIVKVLDFGTSKIGRHLLAGDPTLKGRPSQFSPAYGAPEQWVPDSLGQTGPWTDVWGMALTLVELMKGDHVFSGNVRKAMCMCLDRSTRPTPRNHGVEVSDAIEYAFSRALALDPQERTQSMRELWLELRSAVAETNDESPFSFGPEDERPMTQRSKSALPFLLSNSNWPTPPRTRHPHPPQTGTFPTARSIEEERNALARTGTDEDRADTVREMDMDWYETEG